MKKSPWRRLTARAVAFALPVVAGVVLSTPVATTAEAGRYSRVSTAPSAQTSQVVTAQTFGRAFS